MLQIKDYQVIEIDLFFVCVRLIYYPIHYCLSFLFGFEVNFFNLGFFFLFFRFFLFFGLFFLSILQNGLHLAALPSELTGVLTGVLLIAIISADQLRNRAKAREKSESANSEIEPMKNSQVAVVCAAVLLGALIVAGSNVWLVRSLLAGGSVNTAATTPNTASHLTIAMMPKAKGDPYFISARSGAEEAAKELGVDLIWDGPTSLDAARQNEMVESWITRQVDVIAVAVENKAAISTVLRKARDRGIHVLTWDADAEANARDYFVNQATAEGIGYTLTDEAARLLNGRGEFAIITGALSAANQNEWIQYIKQRVAEKYPNLKLATIRPSDDDRDKAFAETQTILRVYPQVKLVMAISAPAVPGAAEAVRQAQRKDVNVIGLSLPSICKPYIQDGTVQSIILWKVPDLGYLTVYAGALLAEDKFPKDADSFEAGKLGDIRVRGSEIILGKPLIINKDNIEQSNFAGLELPQPGLASQHRQPAERHKSREQTAAVQELYKLKWDPKWIAEPL